MTSSLSERRIIILQSIGSLIILVVSRVCKEWYAAVSRDSAPFLRHVTINIDSIPSVKVSVVTLIDYSDNVLSLELSFFDYTEIRDEIQT